MVLEWIARLSLRLGNCRRDLLDHVIVLNECHMKQLMSEYVRYTTRTGRILR